VIDLAFIDAQVDEMEKIAFLGSAWKGLQASKPFVGHLLGAGAGAVAGGAAGAATAAPENRVRHAIGGAVLGGIAGLVPGQLATKAGRAAVGRLGQRQLHGLTGKLPGHSFKKSHAVVGDARTAALAKMKFDNPAVQSASELKKDMWGPFKNLRSKAQFRAQEHQRFLAANDLTNLPGLVRGYVKPAAGITRRQILKSNLLAPGIGFGVGLPLALTAPSAVESVQQRSIKPLARGVVENASFALGGGLPIGAAMAAGYGGSRLAGLIGKAPPVTQPIAPNRTTNRAQPAMQGQVIPAR